MQVPIALLCAYYEIKYRKEFRRIRNAVVTFNELKERDLNECGGIPRWQKYNQKQRVGCAAIRYGDYIVTGVRHYCPMMRLQIEILGYKTLNAYATCYHRQRAMAEQGFVSQHNEWLSREEALRVALDTGQVFRNHDLIDGGELFSEMIV